MTGKSRSRASTLKWWAIHACIHCRDVSNWRGNPFDCMHRELTILILTLYYDTARKEGKYEHEVDANVGPGAPGVHDGRLGRGGGRGKVVGGEGERMVQGQAMASGVQLQPEHGDQRTGDVA